MYVVMCPVCPKSTTIDSLVLNGFISTIARVHLAHSRFGNTCVTGFNELSIERGKV
jgi:hypothetical protein